MKISGIVQILFIFFFAAKASFGQPGVSSNTLTPLISYKHFGEEEGLNCKNVYEALQDENGFIWFGTDAGVFRYDGRTFKRYTIADGLGDNEVLKIHRDRFGRIWFLTFNGNLSFWKEGKIYNSGNTAFLKNAFTGGSNLTHYEDTRGRLWIGTDKFGFIVINGDSVSKIKFPFGDLVQCHYIHEDSKGVIWTFDQEKMYRLLENKFNDTITLPDSVRNFTSCHGKNSLDFFYVSSGNVFKIQGPSASLYLGASEIGLDVKAINIVADGDYLWLFTPGRGCIEFFKGEFSRKYLERTTVTFAFKDRENNLWFNTMGEGVYMLPADNNYITNYNAAAGLPGNNITSIAERHSEIWLGFTKGEVSKVEGSNIITFTLNPSINPSVLNRITGLVTGEDAIFCGTDMGVFTINDNKMKPASHQDIINRLNDRASIKHLFMDREKNIFASHSDGAFKFVKGINGYFFDGQIRKFTTRTFSATEYQNRVLLATRNGLMHHVEGKVPVEFRTEVDFSTTRLLDMKPDKDLLILAANGEGLYFLKDKKLHQHLTTADGLSDNNCKRIFISNDTMYISTDHGINILTKQNNHWNISKIISTKNGLLSDNINEVLLNNGKIYAATEKGLSIVDPGIAYRDQFVGRVYVTEIITDTVSPVTDSSYSFKADIPRLLIRFAYPVFNPANELTVKYRMLQSETDNPEWISSENHEVEFSSLSPGQYVFQLMAGTQSVSTTGITNLYINIIPLWWQTNAARVSLALLIIGLIALMIRARFRLQYKKKLRQLAMLEAERSRIASDMHDDIGADLTQISIWSNILEASKNKDTTVLSRIIKSSNEVLQKMEQIIWALNSFHNHTNDLISYLREYASQYLESAGINLSFEIPGTMPELEVSAIQKRNIFLTVKELLHNTVKHSGAKKVEIRIYVEDSTLNIEYQDDGRGFTPKEREDGMGNITVQRRMKEINSAISIKTGPGLGFSAQLKIRLEADSKRIKTNTV